MQEVHYDSIPDTFTENPSEEAILAALKNPAVKTVMLHKPLLNEEKEKYMQPHQERVVAEKKELDEKREKLGTFIEGEIFQALSSEERNRLEQQAIAMTRYSTLLGERIAAFETS